MLTFSRVHVKTVKYTMSVLQKYRSDNYIIGVRKANASYGGTLYTVTHIHYVL